MASRVNDLKEFVKNELNTLKVEKDLEILDDDQYSSKVDDLLQASIVNLSVPFLEKHFILNGLLNDGFITKAHFVKAGKVLSDQRTEQLKTTLPQITGSVTDTGM